jgi:hypothetical protein
MVSPPATIRPYTTNLLVLSYGYNIDTALHSVSISHCFDEFLRDIPLDGTKNKTTMLFLILGGLTESCCGEWDV